MTHNFLTYDFPTHDFLIHDFLTHARILRDAKVSLDMPMALVEGSMPPSGARGATGAYLTTSHRSHLSQDIRTFNGINQTTVLVSRQDPAYLTKEIRLTKELRLTKTDD